MMICSTRTLVFRWCFCLLSIVSLWAACKKIDPPQNKPPGNVIQRFFGYDLRDPIVTAIHQKIYRQNQSHPFVTDFVKYGGYPKWDKASVITSVPTNPGARSADIAGKSIVYIPFVPDFGDHVGAVLVVRISGSDTLMRMFYCWQYADYGYSKTTATAWDAYDVFSVFASMEYAVFGYTKFEISDTNLVHPRGYGHAILTRNHTILSDAIQRSENVGVTECTTWDVCIPYLLAKTTGSGCYQQYQVEYCTTSYYETDSGSGGGGSGTGDGGGGWSDNPCRNLPAAGGNPCGGSPPGWTPIPDDGSITLDPIDSLLAKYSRAVNHLADSMMTLAANNHNWEYVTTVVKKDSSIYGKNVRTDRDSLRSDPDMRLSAGETLLATLHTHRMPAVPDRSAPSPGDLDALEAHLIQNFILFVECGNVRFALVIEDVGKATRFFRSERPQARTNRYLDSTMAQPTAFTDWQGATTVGLRAALRSSGISGIGFYISTNSEKTIYTKIN